MPKKLEPGRALVRKNKQKKLQPRDYFHPSETNDWCRLPVKSITQETSLDDFFHTANLSNIAFTAQKLDVKVLSKAELVGIVSTAEQERRKLIMEQNKDSLRVLKRPKIDKTMTKKDITDAEQMAYLEWRRDIAKLEHLDGITVTPYERNLEFWRQLWQVIEKSDILLQVVDARQPLLFFSSSLNEYIKEVGVEKQTLILVNKSDLLTGKQRTAWANYFASIGLRALFFSALKAVEELAEELAEEENIVTPSEPPPSGLVQPTKAIEKPSAGWEMSQDFIDELISSDEEDDENSDQSTLCDDDEEQVEVDGKEILDENNNILSVGDLIDLLVSSGTRKPGFSYLTVGLLGYPNVGKSSTLNALIGKKKVSVSATPGHTKHYQTIFLQPDLQLCDCPGMVMPSFAHTPEDLVVAGILSIDEMHDCLPPIRLICEQIPREVLNALYGIKIPLPKQHEDQTRPPTPHELLATYACIRGFMGARGNPHYDRAARIILKDYVKGRLRYNHAPPGMDTSTYQLLDIEEEEYVAYTYRDVPAHFFAYVSHSDFPKLYKRLKADAKLVASDDVSNTESATAALTHDVLTTFDRIALSNDARTGDRLVRSNKKLAPMNAVGIGSSANFDDAASSLSAASWSTCSSVGGSSLLSGMSTTSSVLAAGTRKPWRQLSAIKTQHHVLVPGGPGAKKTKKKEKLRRVYVDMDKHELV